MLDSFRKRARSVALVAVAAALTVGGVALAQGSSESGQGEGSGAPSGKGRPPGPPMMLGAPGGKDLTYAQLHVQHNGKAEVIRMDQGEITAVDEGSITLKENDGSEVTIAVDDSTRVLAGPGKSSLSDLETGEEVTVCGPEGEAAKAIMVPPKRGQVPQGLPGARKDGQLPPPPGAQMRG
jgi:hypothetical protein